MVYLDFQPQPGVVTTAFCPSEQWLAAGTITGAVDAEFTTDSHLQVYGVNFGQDGREIVALGKGITAPERFKRLIWGKSPAPDLPCGILAGGLADGSICVWDPLKIIKGGRESGMLAEIQHHQGAVSGLDQNPLKPNWLASGAGGGDVALWDLGAQGKMSHLSTLQDPRIAGTDITWIHWNRKSEPILASCHSNGLAVVWDERKKRLIAQLGQVDQRKQNIVLQWSPVVATQLFLASDCMTTIQLWDLRNSMTPVRELVGHRQGVLSLSWCPQDTSLLLSSGKDGRTVCWDTNSGEVVADMATGQNWQFDISWSPKTPGMFSASTFDGKLVVANMEAMSAPERDNLAMDFGQTGRTASYRHAPTWLKRPCGVAFGFGGKMVHMTNEREGGTIHTYQVITDQEIVDRSQQFAEAMQVGDKAWLREYCKSKSNMSGSQEEQQTWGFLGILFEEDARFSLLSMLGFADALPKPVEPVQEIQQPVVQEPAAPQNFASDDDFFDQMGEQAASAMDKLNLAQQQPSLGQTPAEDFAIEETTGEEEENIRRMLMVGNYQAAIDICLQVGRSADALVIAHQCGGEILATTVREHMRKFPKPYMHIIRASLDADFEGLITSQPLSKWQETLAILATYSTAESWGTLCSKLAERLIMSGNSHAAILCYICAGNVDEVVKRFSEVTKQSVELTSGVLQDVLEKSLVMGMAANQTQPSEALGSLLGAYASMLAAQGQMDIALSFLNMLPGTTATDSLRERIQGLQKQATFYASATSNYQFYNQQQVASAFPAAHTQFGGYAQQDNTAYQTPALPAQPPVQQKQFQNYGPYAYDPSGHYESRGGGQESTTAAAMPHPSQPNNSLYSQHAHNIQQPQLSMPTPYTGSQSSGSVPPPYGGQQQQQVGPPPAYVGQQQATAYRGMMGMQDSMQGMHGGPPPIATQPQPQQTAKPFEPIQAAPVHPPPVQQPNISPPPSAGLSQPPQSALVSHVSQGSDSVHSIDQSNRPNMGMGGGVSGAGGPFNMSAYDTQQPTIATPPAVQQPPMTQTPPQPQKPTGPPANISISSADVSQVPADQKAIVTSILNLFNACEAGVQGNPSKKREMDNNSKRLGELFWKLNEGQVSSDVVSKFKELAIALDANDWSTATRLQVSMTTTHWDEASAWLTALKRLLKLRQMLG